MEFTPEEKKILMAMGRNEYGKPFIAIMEKMRDSMSDIDTIISTGGDYGAQVEGRKIFKDFCKKLLESMKAMPPKPRRERGSGDYD